MAQFDAPFSTASETIQGPSLIDGTPAVLEYAQAVIDYLPITYFTAVNDVLEEHVEATREKLTHDPDYKPISAYYDVSGVVQDDGIELEFGFFGVPNNLAGLVSRLEYGDATNPPQGFVRRTFYKQFDDIADDIATKTNVVLGTEIEHG